MSAQIQFYDRTLDPSTDQKCHPSDYSFRSTYRTFVANKLVSRCPVPGNLSKGNYFARENWLPFPKLQSFPPWSTKRRQCLCIRADCAIVNNARNHSDEHNVFQRRTLYQGTNCINKNPEKWHRIRRLLRSPQATAPANLTGKPHLPLLRRDLVWNLDRRVA